jgi:membrane AbrB-like protein
VAPAYLRRGAEGCAALVAGAAGSALFAAAGMPLPWTLGSLSAAAILSIAGSRWLMPAEVRDVARPVVGVLAGSALTPAILASVGIWWPAMLFVLAYSLFVLLLGWMFFRWVCRLDPATAYFSSTPGGLGEMVLQGAAQGGDARVIVLVHSTRVVATVVFVPILLEWATGSAARGAAAVATASTAIATPLDWLILTCCGIGGYVAAKWLRLPGGPMVAAMLLSAAVHGGGLTEMAPPDWLLALVQVVIGAVAGARFADVRWHEARRTLLLAVAWTALLLLSATAMAALAASLFGRPFATMLLALAPGGIVEMTLISYALGGEVAFAIACQLVRNFSVSAVAPVLFDLLRRRV